MNAYVLHEGVAKNQHACFFAENFEIIMLISE